MVNQTDTHPSNIQFSSGSAMPLPGEEINLMDCWHAIRKRLFMIGGLFLVITLVTMVQSFQMPNIYQSSTTLLPAIDSREGGVGSLGSLLNAVGGGGQGLGISVSGVPATPTDMFVAMLKSRTMADVIIEQFHLMEIYGAKTIHDARKTLEGSTTITVTKLKLIKIDVEDTNPQRAADIANAYAANLDRLNQAMSVTKASQNRKYIERRLVETKVNLVREEEEMKEYQVKNKTVAVEAQAAAMMQAAGLIQAQIMAQEVQLEVLGTYLSVGNPDLNRAQSNLDELRKQLHLLDSGKGGKGMLPGARLHPAMITVPTLSLDYARAFRELKVQETLYTLLISQLEQARLAEARDIPTVQVLDPAIPVDKKIKPSIRNNVMIAGAASLFVGTFLAFILEYVGRLRTQRKEQPAYEIES